MESQAQEAAVAVEVGGRDLGVLLLFLANDPLGGKHAQRTMPFTHLWNAPHFDSDSEEDRIWASGCISPIIALIDTSINDHSGTFYSDCPGQEKKKKSQSW